MLEHSDIGASGMSRLIACPGSYALARQIKNPGRRSSIYSATGTAAHALAEEALSMGYDPQTQLGEVVTVDGFDITVDEDMIAATRVYVDEITARFQGATWTALETRVTLDAYWPKGARLGMSAFGTADAMAYHAVTQHLDLIDYKHGAGVFVDVIDSPQLTYYAAGALLIVPGPVLTIDLTVVQPRVRGQQKIRTYRTTSLDVLMWVERVLKPTIAEAMSPGARVAAGGHCKFCPAKANCPALASVAQDMARREFGPTDGVPIEWTDTQLGQVLSDADVVAVHTLALQEVALSKIQSGVSIPGWGVVPSRPLRTWGATTGDEIQAALAGLMGDTSALVYAPKALRSPAALEKLLTPEEWAVVQPFVQSKSSGVRLVPEAFDPSADPVGAAGRATAQDDFA